MNANDALRRLKQGNSLNCIAPNGRHFQIQSKLSCSIAWYRTRPITKGCLNRYSRLSDEDMLRWLGSIEVSK